MADERWVKTWKILAGEHEPGEVVTFDELKDAAEHALKQQPDPVARPSHYTQGDIECIDAIRAALTPEEFRGFCKGVVLKYTWREKHKGGDEDLRKAIAYLNFELEPRAKMHRKIAGGGE